MLDFHVILACKLLQFSFGLFAFQLKSQNLIMHAVCSSMLSSIDICNSLT